MQLAPGSYEFSCSVVEEIRGTNVSHYAEGMHRTFTVTDERAVTSTERTTAG